jgi:hypothetical protein
MPETIGGSVFPVKIPLYADNADIQAAIKYYHYGSSTVPLSESAIDPTSIAGYLKGIDTRLDNLATSEVISLVADEDLDTKLATGKYIQDSNTDAESGQNYPIFLTKKWAGALTVAAYDNTVFQFYEGKAGTASSVVSQGFIAWRSKTSGGVWSSWIFASDTAHLHDDRYYTEGEIDGKFTALTKNSVGLSNVDNTSDANKPISIATQAALDLKATTVYVNSELANKPTSQADNIFVQQTQPTSAVAGDLWFW